MLEYMYIFCHHCCCSFKSICVWDACTSTGIVKLANKFSVASLFKHPSAKLELATVWILTMTSNFIVAAPVTNVHHRL